jgi:hypothetical protein
MIKKKGVTCVFRRFALLRPGSYFRGAGAWRVERVTGSIARGYCDHGGFPGHRRESGGATC